MNVLVLYHFINQKNLMHNFAIELNRKGVVADILCVDNFEGEHYSNILWPLFLRKALSFCKLFEILKVEQHFLSFLYYHYLPHLLKKYDLIDFNAYYGDYSHLVDKCVSNNTKITITLWGSDLMRANERQLMELRYGLDNCSCIKLADSLYAVLSERFGMTYDDKCRITYFGNSDLEVIDSLNDQETIVLKNELYGNCPDKVIVVCGYNAMECQNHKSIIEALSVVDSGIIDQCKFVFPMTYGMTREGYKEEIRALLTKTCFDFVILDSFLSSKQLAVLRKTSDVVINIQSTDAMSASLQDHLFCGNVCIIGEWLHYKPYDDNDVFYLKCNFNNISSIFEDVCSNLESYKQNCIDNHFKIGNFFSWEKTIVNIVDVYKSVLSQ